MASVAKAAGVDVKTRAPAASGRAARGQPDAGPSRLPARHPVPRDLRDAGARHLRGRVRGRGRSGETVVPEVMIPLVAAARSSSCSIKRGSTPWRPRSARGAGGELDYLVGTMIELPRAALRADEIAEDAEFFSFGTNDLTQMTLGLSAATTPASSCRLPPRRDPRRRPVPDPRPRRGVGELVEIAAERGRRPSPTSSSASAASTAAIRPRWPSASRSGLDYVSCSPYRVPIARPPAWSASPAARRRQVDPGLGLRPRLARGAAGPWA